MLNETMMEFFIQFYSLAAEVKANFFLLLGEGRNGTVAEFLSYTLDSHLES